MLSRAGRGATAGTSSSRIRGGSAGWPRRRASCGSTARPWSRCSTSTTASAGNSTRKGACARRRTAASFPAATPCGGRGATRARGRERGSTRPSSASRSGVASSRGSATRRPSTLAHRSGRRWRPSVSATRSSAGASSWSGPHESVSGNKRRRRQVRRRDVTTDATRSDAVG